MVASSPADDGGGSLLSYLSHAAAAVAPSISFSSKLSTVRKTLILSSCLPIKLGIEGGLLFGLRWRLLLLLLPLVLPLVRLLFPSITLSRSLGEEEGE